ncbi:unnamed protein product [Psylliodes chrysocephalus]|uniref:MADF domain-containing protein n=1 Tax=Psylliodes chrysocephalus TaxID=3402493 RepID=A0A9P0D5W3_9CUCU|nr:unnamed protein product [Psylliodes chrysocephala]
MKREWKKLQDCYRQAMLRRKTKSGQSATKTKPWKYEELMSFLASNTLPRSSQSNVLDPDDENSDNVEPIEANDDTQGQHEGEENALEDDQSNSALNSQGPRYNKSLKSNRKNVEKENDGVQKVITFLSKKESTKNKNGELNYFFASACESTKNLPRYLQLRVKQEKMEAIVKAESEYLNTRPQSSATSTSSSVAVQTPLVSPHSDWSEQPMVSPHSNRSEQPMVSPHSDRSEQPMISLPSDQSQQQYVTGSETGWNNPWGNTGRVYGQPFNIPQTPCNQNVGQTYFNLTLYCIPLPQGGLDCNTKVYLEINYFYV